MSLNLKSKNHQNNIKDVKTNDSRVYEFEDFRLDAAHLMLLRCSGEEISMTPKVVETLLALVERPGEIVSKGELMERLWENSFVEEANLIQNIYILRKVVGEMADGRPVIETLRRRGYRFNARVKTAEAGKFVPVDNVAEEIQPKKSAVIPPPIAPPSPKGKDLRLSAIGVLATGCLVVLVILIWLNYSGLQSRNQSSLIPPSNAVFKRLTPDIDAHFPAVSADGKYLAYSQIEHGKASLWLKDITTEAIVQLLPPVDLGEGYTPLHFSPDDTILYYSTHRPNTPNATIFRLTLANGEQQMIAGDDISPSALSPDGRQLVFINSKYDLMIINADGTNLRTLRPTDSVEHFVAWSSQMSWSPDGKRVALCGGHAGDGNYFADIIEIAVSDGSQYRVITPPDLQQIDDVAYLTGESGWLVTARQNQAEPFQIWKVASADGKASRITADNHDYSWFSLSHETNLIIAEQGLGHFNIWTAPLSDTKNIKQLTFGNIALDGFEGIAFFPDGRIVYSSTRSGNVDLWLMNADGSDQKQLTANAGNWNARPNVTPDGRYIVFASMRSGSTQLWRIDTDGGNPRQMTDSADVVFRSTVSADGKWVYYNTESDGSIWKVSIEGGNPILVSSQKSLFPSISPDGKLIASTEFQQGSPNLWHVSIISAATGELIKSLDIQASRRILVWTGDSKSLISMNNNWGNLWEHPINGEAPHQLTDFPNDRNPFFAISPDYKQIVFSRGNSFSEAVQLSGIDLRKAN